MAVLVANVTYLGWATPPGGTTPYWAGCTYPLYTGFLVTNGLAFVLAVLSVSVVTWTPLIAHQRYLRAAQVAGALLLLALAAFMAAFFLSGFVAVNYRAPQPDCATTTCAQGGVKCTLRIQSDPFNSGLNGCGLDSNVVILNSFANLANQTILCYYYSQQIRNQIVANNATQASVLELLNPSSDWQRFTICAPTPRYADLTVPDGTLASVAESGNSLANIVNLPSYVSFSDLRYNCFLTNNTYNTLCEVGQSFNKAVSSSGQYMTIFTASSLGATIFAQSPTAGQVHDVLIGLSIVGGALLALFTVLVLYNRCC